MSSTCYSIVTFYHFFPMENPQQSALEIRRLGENYSIGGIMIIGEEGINATISAPSEDLLQQFTQALQHLFSIAINNFKYSTADISPFKRLSVKIRQEIVTTGIPGRLPEAEKNFHLSASEWNKVIEEEEDAVIIDTRNWYEYQLGTFKRAINPNIEKFTEFPQFFEEQKISKDKKVLIFCTGGIRCEKGILELQDKGHNNVYQLDGGILTYLKESPNRNYVGECFVFDHRVAVDQSLSPTDRYKLCPHCGQPGDHQIICKHCDEPGVICSNCAPLPHQGVTCSKNCAYHYKLNPLKKGKKQYLPLRQRGV